MLRKRLINPIPLIVGAGVSALLVGATTIAIKWNDLPQLWPELGQLQHQISFKAKEEEAKSAVFSLVQLSPQQRASQLQEIAQTVLDKEAKAENLLDRNRARYMLASDLIQLKQGKQALTWLEGLEANYPVLAAHIALKRAQAYEVSDDKAKATTAWKELLERYPENPQSAEALFVLGRADAKLWDKAIAQFPNHPRTLEIVRERLKKNPNQLPLLELLLKYSHDDKEVGAVINQVITKYGTELKAEDWEVIAYTYWQRRDYEKAGNAYAKAPTTPLNLYRAGRGRQLGGDRTGAIAAYERLASVFPEAKDTGLALIRLSRLSTNQEESLAYLDKVISNYPDHAGEALLDKAKILEKLGSTKSASQARQLALTKHGNSDAVVEYRWKAAKERAKAGDYTGAWRWAEPITKQNPDSELAPEAAYWVGRWATQVGRSHDAKAAFEYVLTHHPGSYYAWRSAQMLGLNVGDFKTVRQLIPQVTRPEQRSSLPAGSPTLRELYQLGQNRDAWTLWQTEFDNTIKPTVAEQFTDGILLLGVGENLRGINQLESLSWWRDTAEERSQIKAIKQQSIYWHALYPFPFLEYIENWSQQHQLNPLLVTSLIRQESRFETSIRSVAGAVGLMQVMPSTGTWIAQTINLKNYSLENPNDNIRLGTWYLDHTHETYKNNSLLAVASYNAGPGNVSKWISQFGSTDPDEFVESIPFPETKGYVEHVFENYWNYLRLYNPEMSQIMTRYGHRKFHP